MASVTAAITSPYSAYVNLNPDLQKSNWQVGCEFLKTKDFYKIFDLFGQLFLRIAEVYKKTFAHIDLSAVKEVSLFGKKVKLAMSSAELVSKYGDLKNASDKLGKAWGGASAYPAEHELALQSIYYDGMTRDEAIGFQLRQIIRHFSDLANSGCDLIGLTAYFVAVRHLLYFNAVGSLCTLFGSITNLYDDWIKLCKADNERVKNTTDLAVLNRNITPDTNPEDSALIDATAYRVMKRGPASDRIPLTPDVLLTLKNGLAKDIARCTQETIYHQISMAMDAAYIGVGALGYYAFLTAAFSPYGLYLLIAGWICSVTLFVFKNWVDPFKQNQDGKKLAREVAGGEYAEKVTTYYRVQQDFFETLDAHEQGLPFPERQTTKSLQDEIYHLQRQVQQLQQDLGRVPPLIN